MGLEAARFEFPRQLSLLPASAKPLRSPRWREKNLILSEANCAFLQGQVFVLQTSNIMNQRGTWACRKLCWRLAKIIPKVKPFSYDTWKRKALLWGVNKQQVLWECVANKSACAHMSLWQHCKLSVLVCACTRLKLMMADALCTFCVDGWGIITRSSRHTGSLRHAAIATTLKRLSLRGLSSIKRKTSHVWKKT